MSPIFYWDANAFIGLLEASPKEREPLARMWVHAEAGRIEIITSTMTIAEVLVLPFKNGDGRLLQAYGSLLGKGGLARLVETSTAVWLEAATNRALLNLKLADAVHLATARRENAKALISADKRLPSGSKVVIVNPQSAEMDQLLSSLE